MAGVKPNDEFDELDWVKVREDLDSSYRIETIWQKAKRKTQENPLVPIGKLTYVPRAEIEFIGPDLSDLC